MTFMGTATLVHLGSYGAACLSSLLPGLCQIGRPSAGPEGYPYCSSLLGVYMGPPWGSSPSRPGPSIPSHTEPRLVTNSRVPGAVSP